jgi:hypothetical protein
MNRSSSLQRTLVVWATRVLLVMALSTLVAVHTDAADAQERSTATPMPTSVPTPAVSDATRAATTAALNNSTQNAWQTLQQGQMLQNQMQQQAANERFRAR